MEFICYMAWKLWISNKKIKSQEKSITFYHMYLVILLSRWHCLSNNQRLQTVLHFLSDLLSDFPVFATRWRCLSNKLEDQLSPFTTEWNPIKSTPVFPNFAVYCSPLCISKSKTVQKKMGSWRICIQREISLTNITNSHNEYKVKGSNS